MRPSGKFLWLLPLACLIFPSEAGAGILVSLKNGRTIIADSCRDAQTKLVCEKLGGTFDLNKADIASTKEVTLQEQAAAIEEPVADAAKKEQGKGDAKAVAPAGAARAQGVDPETQKRLDEIYMKKLEMKVEREKLISDREQLHEDVKNAGVVRSTEKFESFKNRIADLETKIKKFNADAEGLNEEEKKLLEPPQK